MAEREYQLAGVIRTDSEDDARAIYRILLALHWNGSVRAVVDHGDGSETVAAVNTKEWEL